MRHDISKYQFKKLITEYWIANQTRQHYDDIIEDFGEDSLTEGELIAYETAKATERTAESWMVAFGISPNSKEVIDIIVKVHNHIY